MINFSRSNAWHLLISLVTWWAPQDMLPLWNQLEKNKRKRLCKVLLSGKYFEYTPSKVNVHFLFVERRPRLQQTVVSYHLSKSSVRSRTSYWFQGSRVDLPLKRNFNKQQGNSRFQEMLHICLVEKIIVKSMRSSDLCPQSTLWIKSWVLLLRKTWVKLSVVGMQYALLVLCFFSFPPSLVLLVF